jgi:hypothetical protein
MLFTMWCLSRESGSQLFAGVGSGPKTHWREMPSCKLAMSNSRCDKRATHTVVSRGRDKLLPVPRP